MTLDNSGLLQPIDAANANLLAAIVLSTPIEFALPPQVIAEWQTVENLTITDLGNGWNDLEKTGGGTSYTDGRAYTDVSFAGDFSLMMRRFDAGDDLIFGVNDTQTGAYTDIERGGDANSTLIYSFETGFSSVTGHGGFTLDDFAILKREGTTLSLYMSKDPYHPGELLREWTGDSAEYFGNLVVKIVGYNAQLRMAEGPERGFVTHLTDAWEAGAAIDRGTHVETAPFARYVFDTTATSIDIASWNNIFTGYPMFCELGLVVDGVHQSVQPGATGAQSNNVVLSAGTKRIEIVNGLQTNGADEVLGTFFTGVSGNAALTPVDEPSQPLILFYGDSITVGDASDEPPAQAYPMLVRAAADSNRVGVEGWGVRSLNRDCGTAINRAGFVAKIKAWNPAVLWIAIGTNDYGLNLWTAADFGTAYAALLDDLHTAMPSLEIYCQTPIDRSTETANGLGSTLPDYRSQIATAVSSRTSYATLVDGTAILSTADLADGVHPTTAGHAIYGAAVIAELGL